MIPSLRSVVILIPVFNDWESLFILLKNLDNFLSKLDIKVSVVIVDDASTVVSVSSWFTSGWKCIDSLLVVELKRNLGSQRAIAIGLAYIEANISCDAVVVMDGDGEDKPEDVSRLIEKCCEEKLKKVIFAYRRKRSESQKFKFFYLIYKKVFQLLTGRQIRFGNFSIVPRRSLNRLVAVAEIWNHYASGVIRSRLQYSEIVTDRGDRIAGESKMNFTALVTHGLSSLSVYSDVIGTRLLLFSLILILVGFILVTIVISIRLFTNLAIPGWSTFTIGLLCLFILQTMTISLLLMFIVLGSRSLYTTLPCRDYQSYIIQSYNLYSEVSHV
ncbi:glycosyltransferase [Chlorogloeopsis sp. ULAP01]|uniref:glycosyltransferase n=1 Tax=Chlorogloeopsis sp. ULAP01 TaxID=3056483 RepID=UPI0025AB0570|nr:glycosyltransferase [Chlorogloeopsis sp. ULAP01]MDM9383278.1 glycosyltransferase [Chlorogloeopsis sp. ULAP01]